MSLLTLADTNAVSPKGQPFRLDTRPDTNDGALVSGISGEDEYGLASLPPIDGWILDIGAHIGIVTVALAVDHPDARIVAVEAIPENAELVARNVERNGLSGRVFVESAGAGAPGDETVPVIYGYEWVGVGADPLRPVVDAGYLNQSRFIGNIFEYPAGEQQAVTEDRPGLSLSAILDRYAIDRVALLKIDCEGCEYRFLRDPAVARVDLILGEFHHDFASLRRLLTKTHTVSAYSDHSLFRAVRR